MSFVLGILPALYLQWANNWFKGFVILLATEAASLLALALNQRGKSELAAGTLSWAGFLCACSMVYFSRDGYKDLALLLFPAMLATAALLLSRRPYIVYAIFVVVAAATLIFLQVQGLNPFSRQRGAYFDLLNVAIILTLISVALGLLSNAMRRGVADYRALIEQAGEGVIVLDERRRIRMCNSTAAEILGVAARGVLGHSFQDFFQPEDLSILDAAVARDAGKISIELTARRPDGSLRYLLTTCTPRLSLDGRTDGVIVVLRDITKSREAEHQIRLLAQALRSTDSCVRISDMSDRMVYVNPAFLNAYGYSESELLGQSIEIIRSPRNAPGQERQILASALMEGWNGELLSRSKDGREFPTALTCSAVRNERGEAIAIVGVSRDLTKNKEVEGALAESRQRFQALLEQGDLMTLLLDKSGTVTFCNDSLLSLLGISREEVIGRAATDLLVLSTGEEHIRLFEAALRLGKPHALKEIALIDSQGRSRWFQWSITPLQGVDGTITELACCRLRDHRTANVAGAVSPGFETGQHRPPRRRHRSRFQQPADGHQRIQHDVAGSAAHKRPESGFCKANPRRRLARGQSHEAAIDLQPKAAHSAPRHGPQRGTARVPANARASDRGRCSAGHDTGSGGCEGDGRPRPDPSGHYESGLKRP
jgi:PAS domain S-box-containing protein